MRFGLKVHLKIYIKSFKGTLYELNFWINKIWIKGVVFDLYLSDLKGGNAIEMKVIKGALHDLELNY